MWHDRKTHRYVKCPYCKAQLRVKYQRGKHKVHCLNAMNTLKKEYYCNFFKSLVLVDKALLLSVILQLVP